MLILPSNFLEVIKHTVEKKIENSVGTVLKLGVWHRNSDVETLPYMVVFLMMKFGCIVCREQEFEVRGRVCQQGAV